MLPRFLRDHRARLLQPHRIGLVFAAQLAAMAELLDALGRELDDARWHTVASILDGAATKLRELAS